MADASERYKYFRDRVKDVPDALGTLGRDTWNATKNIFVTAADGTPSLVRGVGGALGRTGNGVVSRGAGIAGGVVGVFNSMARAPLGQAAIVGAVAYGLYKGVKSFFTRRHARAETEALRAQNDMNEMRLNREYPAFNNDVTPNHVASQEQRGAAQAMSASR